MPHKVVVDPDPEKIVLKRGMFLEVVGERLKAGSKVFISNLDHRNVWRYKKRLLQLSGKKVEAEPVLLDGVSGYLFSPAQDREAFLHPIKKSK